MPEGMDVDDSDSSGGEAEGRGMMHAMSGNGGAVCCGTGHGYVPREASIVVHMRRLWVLVEYWFFPWRRLRKYTGYIARTF
jgi:hypothetical protein